MNMNMMDTKLESPIVPSKNQHDHLMETKASDVLLLIQLHAQDSLPLFANKITC